MFAQVGFYFIENVHELAKKSCESCEKMCWKMRWNGVKSTREFEMDGTTHNTTTRQQISDFDLILLCVWLFPGSLCTAIKMTYADLHPEQTTGLDLKCQFRPSRKLRSPLKQLVCFSFIIKGKQAGKKKRLTMFLVTLMAAGRSNDNQFVVQNTDDLSHTVLLATIPLLWRGWMLTHCRPILLHYKTKCDLQCLKTHLDFVLFDMDKNDRM